VAKNPDPPSPTDAELALLRVLWDRGPSTVREVHAHLVQHADDRAGGPRGYTTVLKLLQIMTTKRLVRRDETDRSHVYAAAVPQEQTQRRLVRDLLDKAFGGSAAQLVVQALAARRTTPEELAEVQRLIAQMKDKPKD
jgi:BlaI family transcriptional regulator, penicillinase repressor